MSKSVKIRKGVDIKLKGSAEKVNVNYSSDTYVIKPADFHGLTPKLLVKVGAEVKAGDPLLYDKYSDRVKFTAPVSGEVVEINRGAKRKLLEIKILADKDNKIQYREFRKADPSQLSREEVMEQLLESGLWPYLRQRPYAVVAHPDDKPKAIHVSAFDSAPLAPDNDHIVHDQGKNFQTGLDALAKLTDGKVHLNIRKGGGVAKEFQNAKGVVINTVSGPHPSGNVGVQIHHIDPVNKGERVWALGPQDVINIGLLFNEGRLNASRIIALAGSEVTKPRYYNTLIGASVAGMLKDNVSAGDNRVISGNVLSGTTISADGYVGFYDTQITVIPEGRKEEFLGWISPGFDKFSLSRTFFSWLTPGKKYSLNTNKHGEERAFVMTGQYERVFPMDIYPVYLIKAIMMGDIEQMENLGIYEVAPEDFALCEYACTSKIDVQDIVRRGLDEVKKECG